MDSTRLVEEKVELELQWDEGKQRLDQAVREWEKWRTRAVLSDRYLKRSAAAADCFYAIFGSFTSSSQTSTNFLQFLFVFSRPSLRR